jgi:hypothetical protein
MHPGRDERMLQCIVRRYPPVWVEVQATVQQIVEKIQLLRLCITHTAGRSHEARAEIAGWLNHG